MFAYIFNFLNWHFYINFSCLNLEKRNGLNVTIVNSHRSLCTSSDVSQTYNFPVAFSARTDVDLFTCFRKNPDKFKHEKKPDYKGKFCLSWLLSWVRFFKESLASKRTCHFLLPNVRVQNQASLMTGRLGIEWKGLIRFRFCRRSLKSTYYFTRKTERLQFWTLLFNLMKLRSSQELIHFRRLLF